MTEKLKQTSIQENVFNFIPVRNSRVKKCVGKKLKIIPSVVKNIFLSTTTLNLSSFIWKNIFSDNPFEVQFRRMVAPNSSGAELEVKSSRIQILCEVCAGEI